MRRVRHKAHMRLTAKGFPRQMTLSAGKKRRRSRKGKATLERGGIRAAVGATWWKMRKTDKAHMKMTGFSTLRMAVLCQSAFLR